MSRKAPAHRQIKASTHINYPERICTSHVLEKCALSRAFGSFQYELQLCNKYMQEMHTAFIGTHTAQ